MSKFREKEEALELRNLGKSYSEIKQAIKVSKSTLSRWLRNHPLSKERIRALRDWNQRRIERYRETRRRKKNVLLREIYLTQIKSILPFSHRDIFIAGLFLYWGEGGKAQQSEPSLSNTNPAAIRAFMMWLKKGFGIGKEKMVVKLHLYSDMDIKKETIFWSKTLSMPIRQFKKPYIKKSSYNSLSYKKSFGHGTCNVIVRDAILGRKIAMSLKVVEDYFNGHVAQR